MKIARFRNRQGKIWLNVASSTYVLPEFTNFDNHIFLWMSRLPGLVARLLPAKYADAFREYRAAQAKANIVRRDCRKPLALPDNSVDHILCSHFLEHVYPIEAELILNDFYRALKPGGTAHIIVPDLDDSIVAYCRARDEGDEQAADIFVRNTILSTDNRGSLRYRLLEAFGGFGLQHRWMYDGPSIKRRIRMAGFELLDENATPSREYRAGDESVHVVARKPLSAGRERPTGMNS